MKKSAIPTAVALPAVALLALAAGCSSGSSKPSTAAPPSSSSSSSAPSSPNSSSATASSVSTGTATVSGAAKTVLVAQDGKTLYYFTPDDATGQPTCTGACATTWPPLKVAAPTAATGVTGKLAVVMGANGDQVTYNGHPLYEFSKDTAGGQANGEGVLGKWHVATPDLAAAATQPAPSGSTSSGGGYGNG
jgi:predicted lipoprotein with Yx(FWY)xxD motif